MVGAAVDPKPARDGGSGLVRGHDAGSSLVRLFEFMTTTEDPGHQLLPRTGDTIAEDTEGTEIKESEDGKGAESDSFDFGGSLALCPPCPLWLDSFFW